nr:hypothetical protein [Neoroseomonas terrae]
MKIRRRPGRKTVVIPIGGEGGAVLTRTDPALVKALARAFRYQRLLDDGRYASITEMAEAERVERGYLGTLLRLTLLAPDIIQTMIDARAPEGANLPFLLGAFPECWTDQRDALRVGSTG